MRIQSFLTSIGLSLIAISSVAEQLTVTAIEIPQRFTLDGTIEAINTGTLSAQTSGVIKAIYGDVNKVVNKGDLLIEIDDIQQQATVAQAEATLAQAKALNDDAQGTMKRSARLYKQGTLSKGEYDRALAQAKSTAANVQVVTAALSQAKTQLSYARITAPYAGIITARFVETGELVSPGQALMSGYDTSTMRVVASLPQQLAKQYTSEQQVTITLGDAHYAAANVMLFPYADPQRHSVQMRAQLPGHVSQSSSLIPGEWVKVTITTDHRLGFALPETAIMHRGELTATYVQKNERSTLRQLRLGNAFQHNNQTWFEILSGLSEGDIVYRNALKQLAVIANQQEEGN